MGVMNEQHTHDGPEPVSNFDMICSGCAAKKYPKGQYAGQNLTGKTVKLGFPSTPFSPELVKGASPDEIEILAQRWPKVEHMWVNVTNTLPNGELIGRLANDPVTLVRFFISYGKGDYALQRRHCFTGRTG